MKDPMKSVLKCAAYVLLLSAGVSTLVYGLWGRLPWKEYEAVAKLRCYEICNGEKHYGLDGGKKNVRLFETIANISDEWRNDKFRAAVCGRLQRKGLKGKIKGCVYGAKINVRCDRECVSIVTRSDDKKVARECAISFANVIIDAQKEEAQLRVAQGVEQLKRNHDKQMRHVNKIVKELDAARVAGATGSKIADQEKELVKQQKVLKGVQEDIIRMSEATECGIFFENMPQSDDNIFVVPPKLSLVVILCVCVVSLITVLLCLFRDHGEAAD